MLPLLFLILDQATKAWVRHSIAIGATPYSIGPFGLTHFENASGPFSLPIPSWPLLALHAGVLFSVVFAALRSRDHRRGLFFIVAGGFSNLIDRFFFGATTDYLALPFHGFWNLADVAVLIGITLIFLERERSPQPSP